ncbi:MAG: hypothetical protein ACYC9O_20860, partial [Candidatus Latescibacterota bacterium]
MKVRYFAVAFSTALIVNLAAGSIFAATEADRKAEVEKFDKKNLRFGIGMMTDASGEFLKIPDKYPGKRDFEVAKTPPTIDFAPNRCQNPYFFPEDNKGLWSQW